MYLLFRNSLLSFLFLLILFIGFDSINSGANTLHLLDNSHIAEVTLRDVFFEIVEPNELKYTYRARPAKDFGLPFNETFYQRQAYLVPVQPPHSCGFPSNADHLRGNIALIERGDCSFLSKTMRAQEAGAAAVIIADNKPLNDDFYIEMVDDNTERSPDIPAAFLLGVNGRMIRRTLEMLEMHYAVVNIPLNVTYIPFHDMNQPPWLLW